MGGCGNSELVIYIYIYIRRVMWGDGAVGCGFWGIHKQNS